MPQLRGTTYDSVTLQPVQTSVSYLPTYTTAADGIAEVTVSSSPARSWKFWAGLAVGAFALYILAQSMKHAGRHG